MGGIFSYFYGLFGPKEIKAGKTTILYKLHLDEVVETSMWDLGGQSDLRSKWQLYFEDTNVVIFVIDASDKERFRTVKKELFALLPNEHLKNAKLLIYANKQDKENAASAEELTKMMNLHKIKTHDWHIQNCCALSGNGLKKGLNWILHKMKE